MVRTDSGEKKKKTVGMQERLLIGVTAAHAESECKGPTFM